VPIGSATAIAAFYREIMAARANVSEDEIGRFARVDGGIAQGLLFRETSGVQLPYDGHHIQIYLADFSGRRQGWETEA
jgi:hypothetical protein